MTREEIIAAARQFWIDNPPEPLPEERKLAIQTIMEPEATGLAA